MRVVILSETYSPKMGYAENVLPKALARLGVEVHLLTTRLHPYYKLPDFQKTFSSFINTSNNNLTVEDVDGYRVHYLQHSKLFGHVRMRGLYGKLKLLKPDIVQTFASISWIPLEAALLKPFMGWKLFTGNHNAASTYPIAKRKLSKFDKEYIVTILKRFIHGRIISYFTEKCYAVTVDCADIAVRFFGVQRAKVEVMHLGVDTDVFFPIANENNVYERENIRTNLGVAASDIVCIYTGKFTTVKNPLILCKAIERLRIIGKQYFGVFIGDGVQSEALKSYPFCTVLPFMPYRELAPYYRAADIGVWPTDESTSTLDAAACGLPLIVSDGIVYWEHVEGNGLVFKMNNLDDLIRTILQLYDPDERIRLGSCGAKKMADHFSWDSVAIHRLKDYKIAMKHRHAS